MYARDAWLMERWLHLAASSAARQPLVVLRPDGAWVITDSNQATFRTDADLQRVHAAILALGEATGSSLAAWDQAVAHAERAGLAVVKAAAVLNSAERS